MTAAFAAPVSPQAREGGVWPDAVLAATLFALDPFGLGGVALRARPGPARDLWLAILRERLAPEAPLRRLPACVGADRLLGGLDLSATLRAGRPIAERGILAQCDGGVLIAGMAERLASGPAAMLAATLDEGVVCVERDGFGLRLPARVGIVALDEGEGPDETAPPALLDRLAFRLYLDDIALKSLAAEKPDCGALARARAELARVAGDARDIAALVEAAARLGIASPRAPLLALRAARALAALDGRAHIADADLAIAARLVFAPRAVYPPTEAPPAETGPEDDRPGDEGAERADPSEAESAKDRPEQGRTQDLRDLLIEAVAAAIPPDLLARLAAGRGAGPWRGGGASGQARLSKLRGRPAGVKAGAPGSGARLALAETLRAAAPWQRIRAPLSASDPQRDVLRVRKEDLRVKRYEERAETVTIFAVDASGSSALNRMAEAKGAIELLLADCYARRDQVALVAFRGRGAEILLAPTRSLARARRSLAALPGGGATPLAAGIDAAALLADGAKRRGRTPLLVLLTDGRANIRRDGRPGRPEAAKEALQAGRALALLNVDAILIDTSPRPEPAAAELADVMGARYIPLPFADAAALSRAVKSLQP